MELLAPSLPQSLLVDLQPQEQLETTPDLARKEQRDRVDAHIAHRQLDDALRRGRN
ncbi:MAG: hypothetical protein WDO73_08920 [Ignavibacteriota bacterium]